MLKLKDRIKRLRRGADYENFYTALDIGTEYIKALVVKREGRNGVVLGASRQRQAFSDMQSGVPSDIQGIIDSCDRAMSQAEDMCDTIPGQAVIGIAGEQVKGFSTSVTVPRADPDLKVNEVELMRTLEIVQKRALREARHSMSLELGVPDVNVKLINSAITNVKIDGFAVSNPFGFQGKQMVITVFNTFAPLTHIGALQTIASELDLELVATVAEPYAMARCAATDEVYDAGGIFIDIGGGTTDVALVRNGGIEGTRMFPIGGRVFTKKLASRFGISFADAEAIKLRHSKKELPEAHEEKVHAVLTRDAEVLVEGVAITLQEMGPGRPAADRGVPGRWRERPPGSPGAARSLPLGREAALRPHAGGPRAPPGGHPRHLRFHRVAARPTGHHADGARLPRHPAAIRRTDPPIRDHAKSTQSDEGLKPSKR